MLQQLPGQLGQLFYYLARERIDDASAFRKFVNEGFIDPIDPKVDRLRDSV